MLNNISFIEKCRKKHGNRYDYSLVNFIKHNIKIKIICSIHGEFEQTPTNHLKCNGGCPKCFHNLKRTNDEFIKDAIKTHGHKYDYSLVDYKDSKTKVKIICPNHGIFEQMPFNHIRGNTCPFCCKNHKSNSKDFIKKSKEMHNNIYNYSLVDYKNNSTKVKIICPNHGIFEQTPANHLKKRGCPICLGKFTKTNEEFIKDAVKIHGIKYDYSLIEYVNCSTNIRIICKEHGTFEQTPNSHLNKSGCPICSKNYVKTNEEFIENAIKIHGFKYDYSLVDYKNAKSKIEIICKKHGIFKQTPNEHISANKCGCPICNQSKGENAIMDFLTKNKIDFITQKKFDECKNKRHLKFDFYLPHINTCIEYNGRQHYIKNEHFGGIESLNYTIKNDNIKKEFCSKNNIKLIIIKYNQNINNKLKKIKYK